MTIKFWSFSSSKTYDKCPKAVEHRYVLKTPKDERDNSAAERGTAIHKELEDYLAGGGRILPSTDQLVSAGEPKPMPVDPQQFKYEGLVGEIKELCTQYPFTQEEMLYFDRDWKPVSSFKEAWLLAAMDVFIQISETEVLICDWKTGKREGNEVKHMMQSQLYALCAWKRNPLLTKFTTKFIYLDQNSESTHVWKAGHMPRFFKAWDEKGKEITSATVFKPKPNKWSCKWCDYNSSCEFAIREGEV